MSKEKININDFEVFYAVVKSLTKFATSAKYMVSETGLTIYSKNDFARCEITSNCITSKTCLEFNILDNSLLLKILGTIKDVHDGDYSGVNFIVDLPTIKFESKRIKTKLITCKEELIEKFISKKVQAELSPVFEFTTTSDLIKKLNSHSFIFTDTSSLRIYLKAESDMENNAIFAELGNVSSDLNNSLTLKFGLVTAGALGDRQVILDFDRLNVFNMIQSNDIKIALMDKNVLVSKTRMVGKNNTVFDLNIYNSIRKN